MTNIKSAKIGIFSDNRGKWAIVLKNYDFLFIKCADIMAEVRIFLVPLRDFLHIIVIFYDTYYKNHRTE